MLDEIKDVTLSEERNRETITKLKAQYREILSTYKDYENEYEIVKVPLELQFENIENCLMLLRFRWNKMLILK